jgi:glyoxylase-like metal-dependent hydrolase (beta-lactamase superfamily II)
LSRIGQVPDVVDLLWLGSERCIATWRTGDVLVDCGPRTTLDTLLEALGDWRPRALLLTHIHFDHAGAAGALVARWPDLQVYVHRRGARHLASPERLEASARRVFGDVFDERFGHLDPIPEENLHALDGGERVLGAYETVATPGHASHHISYLDEHGYAYVGDVAGERLVDDGPVVLPTPPPDIDLDAWSESIEAVAAWRAARFALPHFGEVAEPEPHLDAVREQLRLTRELIEGGASEQTYTAFVREQLDGLDPDLARRYELVVPIAQNYAGLMRWAGSR